MNQSDLPKMLKTELKCAICLAAYTKKCCLQKHIFEVHEGLNKDFKCSIRNKPELKCYEKGLHKKRREPPDSKQVNQRTEKAEDKVKVRQNKEAKKRDETKTNNRVVCTICGCNYTRHISLKRHLAHKHNTGILFRCDFQSLKGECGQTVYYRSDLIRHRRLHVETDDNVFQACVDSDDEIALEEFRDLLRQDQKSPLTNHPKSSVKSDQTEQLYSAQIDQLEQVTQNDASDEIIVLQTGNNAETKTSEDWTHSEVIELDVDSDTSPESETNFGIVKPKTVTSRNTCQRCKFCQIECQSVVDYIGHLKNFHAFV